MLRKSLPLWECGLKSHNLTLLLKNQIVTPFMGVWIEMCVNLHHMMIFSVTPFMGVWIEI